MPTAAGGLHEPPEKLSADTRERHRALASLIEELEAVDWYSQRVDACSDAELAAVLAHNRDEEKEHACMTLEWLRRHDPTWDAMLRRFLFRDGAIAADEAEGDGTGDAVSDRATSGDGSLAIGGRVPEAAR